MFYSGFGYPQRGGQFQQGALQLNNGFFNSISNVNFGQNNQIQQYGSFAGNSPSRRDYNGYNGAINSPNSPMGRSPFMNRNLSQNSRRNQRATSPHNNIRSDPMLQYMSPLMSPQLNPQNRFNRYHSPPRSSQNLQNGMPSKRFFNSKEVLSPGRVRYASPGRIGSNHQSPNQSILTQRNCLQPNSRNQLIHQVMIQRAGSPFRNGFNKFQRKPSNPVNKQFKNDQRAIPQKMPKNNLSQDPNVMAGHAFQTQSSKRTANPIPQIQTQDNLKLQTIPNSNSYKEGINRENQFINHYQSLNGNYQYPSNYVGNVQPQYSKANLQEGPVMRNERKSEEVMQIQKYRSESKEEVPIPLNLVGSPKKTVESLEEYNELCESVKRQEKESS